MTNNSIPFKLNTPVMADGLVVEVTRGDSGLYSFIVVGGTAAEKREAARDFFELIGRELGESFAVTRPHGPGMLYGEARPRR